MSLRVVRIGPGATIQDLGRPGHMHEGVPPGGALVPQLLVAANRSLGNDPGVAALELPLHAATFRAESDITISVDGAPQRLVTGEALTIAPARTAVRYIAFPAGIKVDPMLGGRGTLLVAQFGGLEGRMLRAGDLLVTAGASSTPALTAVPLSDGPLRLVRGPDVFDDSDWHRLLATPWRVSNEWNRTGARLDGEPLPIRTAARRIAVPLVFGAIQITGSGAPVVLGPDHPTTGGYPVIACLVREDAGRFFAMRPGATCSFEQ